MGRRKYFLNLKLLKYVTYCCVFEIFQSLIIYLYYSIDLIDWKLFIYYFKTYIIPNMHALEAQFDVRQKKEAQFDNSSFARSHL